LADAQMCKSRLAAAYTHIESPRSPVGELAVTSMDWCSVDLNSSEHFCCSINQIAYSAANWTLIPEQTGH